MVVLRSSRATLLALGACSELPPTAPTAPALANTSASTTAVAASSTSAHLGGAATLSLRFFNPSPAILPNLLRLHIESTCVSCSIWARTTAIAEQIVTFTGPTTAIASNTTTYTAANGDQLFASWTGTSVNDGPLVTFSGPELYTGGTGRIRRSVGFVIDLWQCFLCHQHRPVHVGWNSELLNPPGSGQSSWTVRSTGGVHPATGSLT